MYLSRCCLPLFKGPYINSVLSCLELSFSLLIVRKWELCHLNMFGVCVHFQKADSQLIAHACPSVQCECLVDHSLCIL